MYGLVRSSDKFHSLMKIYDINYKRINTIIPLDKLCLQDIGTIYELNSESYDFNLFVKVDFISRHTTILSFSYNKNSWKNESIHAKVKVFKDSKQVELIKNKHNNLKFCSRISKYFYKPESESLWYTNYLLSEWLEHCILNNFKVLK